MIVQRWTKKNQIYTTIVFGNRTTPRERFITLCFLVPSSHYQRALTRSEGNDDYDDDSVGCVDNVIYGRADSVFGGGGGGGPREFNARTQRTRALVRPFLFVAAAVFTVITSLR